MKQQTSTSKLVCGRPQLWVQSAGCVRSCSETAHHGFHYMSFMDTYQGHSTRRHFSEYPSTNRRHVSSIVSANMNVHYVIAMLYLYVSYRNLCLLLCHCHARSSLPVTDTLSCLRLQRALARSLTESASRSRGTRNPQGRCPGAQSAACKVRHSRAAMAYCVHSMSGVCARQEDRKTRQSDPAPVPPQLWQRLASANALMYYAQPCAHAAIAFPRLSSPRGTGTGAPGDAWCQPQCSATPPDAVELN